MVALVGAVVLAPQPASAHGAGAATDALSTGLLVAAGASVWWFKSLTRRSEMVKKLRWALLPVAALAVIGAFTVTSWGPKSGPSKVRPETAARLAIVSPAPSSVTGPDVTVRLRLDGGHIVPQSQATENVPDGGHIHTYVDNKLISMVDGLEQDLRGLSPGPHTVRAEFVAADHGPFKSRVVAAVLFEVRA
jgi:hypothetical protein